MDKALAAVAADSTQDPDRLRQKTRDSDDTCW
jgi:hypothetical protein